MSQITAYVGYKQVFYGLYSDHSKYKNRRLLFTVYT